MIPATVVDLIGQEELAVGYSIAVAAPGPATMVILPAAGKVSES